MVAYHYEVRSQDDYGGLQDTCRSADLHLAHKAVVSWGNVAVSALV